MTACLTLHDLVECNSSAIHSNLLPLACGVKVVGGDNWWCHGDHILLPTARRGYDEMFQIGSINWVFNNVSHRVTWSHECTQRDANMSIWVQKGTVCFMLLQDLAYQQLFVGLLPTSAVSFGHQELLYLGLNFEFFPYEPCVGAGPFWGKNWFCSLTTVFPNPPAGLGGLESSGPKK